MAGRVRENALKERLNLVIQMLPDSFPSVSVVIPAYNRAITIGRALDSVFSQTYAPLEVIVIDDGSTDATRDILSSVKEPRLICLSHSPNIGAQAARNRGIQRARGDWIAFLDSDDEWKPKKIEKQVAALQRIGHDPWVVVHTNCLVAREGGKTENFRVPPVSGDDALDQLLAAPGPMFQGMLASKVALVAAGYLDEQVPSYQEWDTAILLARRCRFVFLDEPLFIYHQHAGPTISKNKQRDLFGYDYVIAKHEADILERLGAAALRRHFWMQATRALNFRLWDSSQPYFDRLRELNENAYRLAALSLLRRVRVPPSSLSLPYRTVSFTRQKVRRFLRCLHPGG